MQRPFIVKMTGNVSDWFFKAGGALIKAADSAGWTVGDKTINVAYGHINDSYQPGHRTCECPLSLCCALTR